MDAPGIEMSGVERPRDAAHLDPRTTAGLMRDVFAAAGDRTVLLITHRSEGLDLVDRVIMLRPEVG
jgi:ABC-type transport system involved in cytochrome bd biosynthesis fused ATPase/permease subunit